MGAPLVVADMGNGPFVMNTKPTKRIMWANTILLEYYYYFFGCFVPDIKGLTFKTIRLT